MSGGDGGIPPNPSCPRNLPLLMSDDTLKRHCKFDDICPHGSRCDQASGLCKWDCLSDSQCASDPDGGAAKFCSCRGECVDPTGPVSRPAATQPTLVVAPLHFTLPTASEPFPATPAWGAEATRDFDVSIGSEVLIGDGATSDVTVTPGDHVEIKCPGQAEYAAEPCTFNLGALSIVPGTETYKTPTASVSMKAIPVQGDAGTVGRWEARVGAAGVASSPRIVSAEYGVGFENPDRPAGTWQTVTSSVPSSFHGTGYVQLKTPGGKALSIPITGRGDDLWNLLLYDPAKIISESGRFGLRDNHPSFYGDDPTSHTNDWFDFGAIAHSNGVSGIRESRITNRTIKVHALDAGGVDGVEATFDLYFPIALVFPEQRSQSISVFVHLDATTQEGLFCDGNTACPSGLTCDLGFCSSDKTTVSVGPGGAILSKQESKAHFGLGALAWDLNNQAGPVNAEEIFCGNTHPSYGGLFDLHRDILPVSGEAGCRYTNRYLTATIPTVTPLLVHKDLEQAGERQPRSAAELLRACLKDLNRTEPTTPKAFTTYVGYESDNLPDPAYFQYLGDCISLGQWSTATAAAEPQLRNRLLQQWLEIHSFVATEGLQENELQETVGPIPASPTAPALVDAPSLDVLTTQMEVGWGWFFKRLWLRELSSSPFKTADYRLSENLTDPQGCQTDGSVPCPAGRYCDGSGTWGPIGSNRCVPKPLEEVGDHEQSVGLPTTMLNTMAAHLAIANRVTEQAVMETYAQGGSAMLRQKAVNKAGRALRLALWVESMAQTIYADLVANNNCKTCLSQRWKDRWSGAKGEFQVARDRLLTSLATLQSGGNPLGLRDDDVPLFFGDVGGTNSRYFAASDYLLDGWAAPAVTAAQGSLSAAREAWISRRNSEVQDLDAQANRERILEQISMTYGERIIDNCGPITVGHQLNSSEVLDEWAHENIDLDLCHIDPKCFGTDDVNNTAIRHNIQAQMSDEAAKSHLCKLDYMAKLQSFQTCEPLFQDLPPQFAFMNDLFQKCATSIQSLRPKRAEELEPGATDIACFFGSSAPPLPKCPAGNGVPCYTVCDKKVNITNCTFCNQNPAACPDGCPAVYICNPEDRSGCNNDQCLFTRTWEKYTKYPNGTIEGGTHSGGVLIDTPDELLVPLTKFEDNPWLEVKVDVGPGADQRKWVYTKRKKVRTAEYCKIPVDYLYGFYPESWIREDVTSGGFGAAWAAATETCSSGSLIKFNQQNPDLSGPRYPFSNVPLPMPTLDPKCFSGKMGVAQLAIQEANLKLRETTEIINAKKGSMEDTFESCVKLAKDVQKAEAARNKWKAWKIAVAVVAVVAAAALTVVTAGAGAPALVLVGAAVASGAGAAAAQARAHMDDNIAEMEALLGHNQATQACWLSHRDQLRGLSDAATQVELAYNEIDMSKANLTKMQRDNLQSVMDGRAKLDAERGRKYGSYAHDYWFDEKVERFKKDLEWSRRLTYLAMEAVEYEFQQSLPFRHDILTATNPNALADVVRGLKQEQGSRSINRRRPEESSVVLSLRDDVLKVADRSDITDFGERAWTPAQRFSGQLENSAFAYFGKDGTYMGQAVPFILGPEGVLETRCGERLWRVTATVQGDGLSEASPNTSLLLLKRNTFSSQWCSDGDVSRPAMQSASIYPSAQLFRSGASGGAGESSDFTPALMTPWFNIRRTDFYKDTFRDGSSEELAGRGLYGDYVLLFPKQMLDQGFPIEKVEDVLLRIDYLSVDNLSQ
jgi:hypothetical protein